MKMKLTPLRASGSSERCNWAVLSTALALMYGCAAFPTEPELTSSPAPHRLVEVDACCSDGRADFRARLCQALGGSAEAAECDQVTAPWLMRFDDEPELLPSPPPAGFTPLQVLLIPGAFGDCFGDDGVPFRQALPGLRRAGHRVAVVPVSGRSSSEHNSALIARYFREHPPDPSLPVVLLGYSKGAADVLHFLSEQRELAQRVSAVVSLAGAIRGSPLAGAVESLYRILFAGLPNRHCPPGDGDVLHSLRPDLQTAWLDHTELPSHIRYYSIGAVATRPRVARSLLPTWELLLRHDSRNDGQVLAGDMLIPGSTVLGYLHADHWAVALDIEEELPFLTHRPDPATFPRAALLHAILGTVAADLDARPDT